MSAHAAGERIEKTTPVSPNGTGPEPSRLYRILFPTLGGLIAALFRMRWLHRDRIPKTGGALLVSNHTSYVDPFAMGLGLTARRPIHYMGKIELFAKQPMRWFLVNMHAFPVKRGQADRGAIRRASEILKAGGVVGMFPEGTRKRAEEVSDVQVGAAFLAQMTGAVIVPVGVSGTDRVKPPGKRLPRLVPVTASYGEPIDPAAYASLPKSERLQAMTDAVVAGINAAKAEADAAGRSR